MPVASAKQHSILKTVARFTQSPSAKPRNPTLRRPGPFISARLQSAKKFRCFHTYLTYLEQASKKQCRHPDDSELQSCSEHLALEAVEKGSPAASKLFQQLDGHESCKIPHSNDFRIKSCWHTCFESQDAAVHFACASLCPWKRFTGAMGPRYSVKEGLQILTGSRCMTPRQGILGQCKSSPASKKTTFLIFPVFLGILQWVLVWCRKKGAKTPSSVKDQLLVPQSDLECFTKFHFFSVRVGMSIPNCPAICLAPGRGPARSKGAIPRLDSNKNNFAID